MKISTPQKKRAVHHVVYEIMMYRATSSLLNSGNITEQALVNVLIESFAIHGRNLFEFFYRTGRKDDIVFIDFIDEMNEFKRKKSTKKSLEILPKKANKQVSHLTYTRLNYNRNTKSWNVPEIRVRMDQTIRAFIECLDTERKYWFESEFSKWGIEIDSILI